MIDRGLMGNIGSYISKIVDKEKAPKVIVEFNEIIKITCDQGFDDRLYQEFKRLRCDMNDWNSRAPDILQGILSRLKNQIDLVNKILGDLVNAAYTDFNLEYIKGMLRKRIEVLEKLKREYEASWLERSLSLNKTQIIPPILINLRSEPVAKIVKNSFSDALFVFNQQELPGHPSPASQLSLGEIIEVIELYGEKGLDGSAGDELCKRICVEICSRIGRDMIPEYSPDLQKIQDYFRRYSPESYDRLHTVLTMNMNDKKSAFIRIYQALRDGQSSFLRIKSNFLAGKEVFNGGELILQILEHIRMHPESRTAEAWRLTRAHYKNCNINNRAMMNEIYQWSFDNSGIFKQSKAAGITLFKSSSVNAMQLSVEQIHGGADDSRRGRIRRAISPPA